MIEREAYGVVRVVAGRYRGGLGLYDDDDSPGRAIVYLDRAHFDPYVIIPRAYLVAATAEETAAWRARQ